MKYTNKENYPGYVMAWLQNDQYDYEEGVVSATRLISPARQYALYKKHYDELEIDVSDLIASKYGTAIHAAFEDLDIPKIEQETRLYVEVEVEGEKYKISGKFDMLQDLGDGTKKLIDLKSTSVWSYIFDSKRDDYVKQLSIYKFLANKNGYNVVNYADICMIFTDWSGTRARTNANYPKTRIAIKPIELWDDTKTEEYIIGRLKEFKQAVEKELPRCTTQELWENKGKYKRCGYCMARKFCSQCRELIDQGYVEESIIV